ncbi:uncharacterized protein LOC115228213 [Octopus sinensis]|uniref:Uncharacterized protein LOC115228213 n=1 Tax=Octopus sinensis TaxID=2607531 RepID=A0A6P7U153_9MOLL|nr:uncharacterized protein LOC115228213 [Octopus sinensis]
MEQNHNYYSANDYTENQTPNEYCYPPEAHEMTPICHDFQNGRCTRLSCKYLHVPRGALLPAAYGSYNPYYRQQHMQPPYYVPPCKDYLNGQCRRDGKCRYRHISKSEYMMELHSPVSTESEFGAAKRHQYERTVDTLLYEKSQRLGWCFEIFRVSLLEENIHLRARVTQIEQQISDLRATNNLLVEQLAEYRNQTIGIPLATTLAGGKVIPTSLFFVPGQTAPILPSSTALSPVVSAPLLHTPCPPPPLINTADADTTETEQPQST